jgi:hypothetical protein
VYRIDNAALIWLAVRIENSDAVRVLPSQIQKASLAWQLATLVLPAWMILTTAELVHGKITVG